MSDFQSPHPKRTIPPQPDLTGQDIGGGQGLVVQTATSPAAYTVRDLAVSGDGLSISNGDGQAGDPTLSLADDVAAIEALTPEVGDVIQREAGGWSANPGKRWVLKTGPETVRSSTVLQDDDELTISVKSGHKYLFEFEVWFTSTAAADFNAQVTGPAMTEWLADFRGHPAATTNEVVAAPDNAAGSAHALAGVNTGTGVWRLRGYCQPSANGALTLQWAQDTSDASDTIVLAGSTLALVDLGT